MRPAWGRRERGARALSRRGQLPRRPNTTKVLALLLLTTPAYADHWTGEAESGAEYDSNVHRVEGAAMATPAALGRVGGKLDGAGRGYAVEAQTLIRKALTGATGEDVAVAAASGRYARPVGDRPVTVGARASWYDVFDLDGTGTARAFSLGGADLAVTLQGEHGARVLATAGGRDFVYKPDHDFDWRGFAAGARFERAWSSLELAVDYAVERRSYRGVAFTSGCGPSDPVTPQCFVPTTLGRADLHHVADLDVTYTGNDLIAGGDYEVIVNDSNSYGQSLVRHRMTGSLTTELPARIYATVIATLELDQHLDPLLVARDINDQTFDSIDEENRSTASLQVSRTLGGGWAAEARAAYYTDAVSSDALRFRRSVVYAGLTWNRE